jgi:signal peptidase I
VADRPRRSSASLDPVTDDETPTPQVSGSAPEKRERGFWRELPALIVIALVIAILIKTFLVQAFYIPSQSMEPTLRPGDRVLVCRICTHLTDIHRGDVIVFSDPHPAPDRGRGAIGAFLHWLGEGIGVAQPENPDFIKRVIGLPGDTVEITRGVVYVNGQRLDEPYLDPQRDDRSFPKETVPDGMLYVLGDNRAHSGDSRFEAPEGLGWVPIDVVIGEAFVTVWPPGRWRWL